MGGRRGHNEGSIYKTKKGLWAAAIDFGYENGKRKRRVLYAKTRAEVARKLNDALKLRQEDRPLPSDRQTFAQYLNVWLEGMRSSVRDRTAVLYAGLIRLYIPERLGRSPLTKVTPADLQALYTERLDSGLSPARVRCLHAVLHRALDQAERWGLVPRNVAALTEPPRIPPRSMKTLSPEEAQHLLAAAAGDRLEALYVLALTTGMREGELLALSWQDVNLDTGLAQVRGSLGRIRHEGLRIEETKTGKARSVALSRTAIAALRRHRALQNEERLHLGETWEDRDLVFPNNRGRPMEAGNLRRREFPALLERAAVPRIRFHDLRHTAATLLLGEGVHPKLVSEMLGHANIAMTLDLYSHVTPGMHRQAATVMDAVLSVGG